MKTDNYFFAFAPSSKRNGGWRPPSFMEDAKGASAFGMTSTGKASGLRRRIKKYCTLDKETKELLEAAMENLSLSARSYDKILKIARTIADLEKKDIIEPIHISEAIQYRSLDRQLWL